MAKLTKIYDKGEIKIILNFRDKNFTVTMPEWENGARESRETCFYTQISNEYPYDDFVDYEHDFDVLEFGDDDEIEDALALISDELED